KSMVTSEASLMCLENSSLSLSSIATFIIRPHSRWQRVRRGGPQRTQPKKRDPPTSDRGALRRRSCIGIRQARGGSAMLVGPMELSHKPRGRRSVGEQIGVAEELVDDAAR